jgi:signal transduction histidine kinase
VQSEKLAGLGQMVAGVAHEINNPLAFVGNNVAVMQRDVGGIRKLLELYKQADGSVPADLRQRITELEEQIDLNYTLENLEGLFARSREGLRRIQQIVKDLRDFARLDESDLSECDLNAGITSTLNIIQGHAKRKQVRLVTDLAPLPPVTCYPAKINQVIMNLVGNAIDASHDEGEVTIRSRADGANVILEVKDNGTGIPQAIREKIFDPFFTTKPQGEGTGLGLSISYGIVHDHGGEIEVESEVGKGSLFRVTLPVKAVKQSVHEQAKTITTTTTTTE